MAGHRPAICFFTPAIVPLPGAHLPSAQRLNDLARQQIATLHGYTL